MCSNRERGFASQASQALVGGPKHRQKRSRRDVVGLDMLRSSGAVRSQTRTHVLAGACELAQGAVERGKEQAWLGMIPIVTVLRYARQAPGFRMGS